MNAGSGTKRIAVCLACTAWLFGGVTFGQEKPDLDLPAGHLKIDQAFEAFEKDQYAKSAALLAAAIREMPVERWSIYYLAACSFAGAGNRDAAFRYLEGAFQRGFWYVDFLETHDKLAALHNDRRWPQALAHCRAAQAKINFPLRQELLDLAQEDQQVRTRYSGAYTPPDVLADMARVDLKDQTRLREIIKQSGWPLISKVSFDGSKSAWLIAQHADNDLAFQKQCLELLRAAAARGEAAKENLAYLTDRVLVGEGKKQIYGTQLGYKDGKAVLSPVVDAKNLDRRRKRMGLIPIAVYLQQMKSRS